MEFVEVTREESVAVVTLNRPPVNAMTEDFARELGEAFTECADPEIRSVVVTGQPHFAAGADIKGFQATFDAGVEERTAWTLQESIAILETLEKPTIAAVHGYALGGGLELAMGADFRFLADDARVGQPEILLGLIPGAGGTQRLARLVGYQRAKEMVLTGRQVDAEEALEIGFADQVLPSAELLDGALEAAREWATKATRAIATAKTALKPGFGRPVSEGLLIERDAFNQSFETEDAREGVAAFIEKRGRLQGSLSLQPVFSRIRLPRQILLRIGPATAKPTGPPIHHGKRRSSTQRISVPPPIGPMSNRPNPLTAPTCSTTIVAPLPIRTTSITSVARSGPTRVATSIRVPIPVVRSVRNRTVAASSIHCGWEPKSASSAQTRAGGAEI